LVDDISIKSDRAMLGLPHPYTRQRRPELPRFDPASASRQP